MLLLAETINGETTISLQTLFTLFSLLGGSIVLSITSFVTLHLAVKQLRIELDDVKTWRLEATRQLSDSAMERHAEKEAKKAVEAALAKDASRSGIRPTEHYSTVRRRDPG
jgi:hypothetical protein